MNSNFRRILSVLLLLVMVLTLVPVSGRAAGKFTTTPTGYTSAQDVVYQTAQVSGKTVRANWGARGEDCVFLSTYAQSFYTSEYSFDNLSQLQGGSTQTNAPQSELYGQLQELMTSAHSFYTYYDGNQNVRNFYKYTDCVSNDTSKVALLYLGTLETSNWNSGTIWNQEHVWPKSKLSTDKQIGDIMHLRPADPSENSSRGNTAYGESSQYYDPGVSVRGDCARMVLYMYVRWGTTNTMWGSSGVIQNLDILLKWMAEDPVDTWEMGRNDSVQSVTGTRNVFVDYPEYAWLLFGMDVPSNMTTPSHNAGVSGNPGNGNSGSTGNSGNSGNSGNATVPTDGNYQKVTALNTGDKVVIVAPAYSKALSMMKTGFYNIGVDVSGGFGSLTSDEIFTVTKNSDGSYSFEYVSGKKLALTDQYNSLNDTGAYDKWELSGAGNDLFYLRNTGRTDKDMYLEWYVDKDNWSTHGPADSDWFELAFYKKVESSSGGNTGSNSGSSSGSNTGSNSGSSSSSNTGSNSGSSSGGNTGSNSGSSSGGNTGSNSGSSSGGNTGSNSGSSSSGVSYADATFQKATALNTGDRVYIMNPFYNVALSTLKTGYYNIGVDVSEGLQGITDAEVFTVTKHTDGSYSFATADGKVLALGADYSSLNETGENTAWTLSQAADGTFYLKNVARGNYLEWYADKNNWSSYDTEQLDDRFNLEFYKLYDPNSGNTDVNEPTQEPTQPETQEPTQKPTDVPKPTEPAPTVPENGGEEKKGGWIWIVLSVVLVLGAAGAYVYIAVIRPRQAAVAPTEEETSAPVEEETPVPAEETETPKEEGNEE